jgi:HAE1 family hydrophobic/amphiphilic exporter-1
VLIAAGVGYTFLGNDLFPATQQNSFAINISLPPGSPLDQTDAYVMQLEEILDTLPEVSRYSARVGSARFMGLPMQGGVSNRARIRVKVHPSHADSIETLMDQLRSRISGLNEDAQVFMKRENLLQTAGMESRLELVVEGSDRAQIAEISKQAIQRLEQLPFLSDIQYTLEGTRPEIHIGVDHGNILQQGVSVYQVAKTLRLAIEGVPVARIPLGDEFIQMILTYDRAELVTTNDLAKLGFYNPGGNWLSSPRRSRKAASHAATARP